MTNTLRLALAVLACGALSACCHGSATIDTAANPSKDLRAKVWPADDGLLPIRNDRPATARRSAATTKELSLEFANANGLFASDTTASGPNDWDAVDARLKRVTNICKGC
jgi:hypothetical protein